MTNVETSEVDAKPAPVNVRPLNVCWSIFKGWTSLSETTYVKINDKGVEGGWMLKFIFCFIDTTHELFHLENKVWYEKISSACLQVLFESNNSLDEKSVSPPKPQDICIFSIRCDIQMSVTVTVVPHTLKDVQDSNLSAALYRRCKCPLERLRRKWDANIKMNNKKINHADATGSRSCQMARGHASGSKLQNSGSNLLPKPSKQNRLNNI
jgi:hypothetical protein